MRKLLLSAACVGAMIAPAMQDLHAQSAPADRNLINPNAPKATAKPQAIKPKAAKAKAKAPVDVAKRPATAPPIQRTAQPQITPRDPLPPPTLDRIPFENGSLGISTNKSYSTTTFSDGRITPGFENVQTKDPTYFGFSLSVPTHKNSIFPLPLLSRPD